MIKKQEKKWIEANKRMSAIREKYKDDISQELVSNLNKNVLNQSELDLLKECDGIHDTMEDIINCKSCEVLLK